MRRIKVFPLVDDFRILRSLSKPPTAPIASREIIASSRARIAKSYKRYLHEFSSPSTLTEEKLGLGEAGKVFRNKYHNATESNLLEFIPVRRYKNKCACCPFCGNVALGTLDHYLPEAEGLYGHFAVLSVNLVPMCEKCQRKKWTFIPKSNLDRVIHPYLDHVNEIARIDILPIPDNLAPEAPKFEYRVHQLRHQAGDALMVRILRNHIRRMELNDRPDLRDVLLAKWRGLLRTCIRKARQGDSVTDCANDALATAKEEIPTGRDETLVEIKYDVALLRTICDTPNIINWIETYVASQLAKPMGPGLIARP